MLAATSSASTVTSTSVSSEDGSANITAATSNTAYDDRNLTDKQRSNLRVYITFQTGRVRRILGQFNEATRQFQRAIVLVKAGDSSTPAILLPFRLALAETLFQSADIIFTDGFFGRARNHLFRALAVCLETLVSSCGDGSDCKDLKMCRQLWKVIGDCCLRLLSLFPSSSSLPTRDNGADRDDGEMHADYNVIVNQLLTVADKIIGDIGIPPSLQWLLSPSPSSLSSLSSLSTSLSTSSQFRDNQQKYLANLAAKSFITCLLLLSPPGKQKQSHNNHHFSSRQLAQLYWYQLALSLSHTATIASSSNSPSVRCLRIALRLCQGHNYSSMSIWSALGIMYGRNDNGNDDNDNNSASAAAADQYLLIKQHCLIKSIKCDPLNATVWSNLGVLYLQAGDRQLALQCFQHSQTLDPEWPVGKHTSTCKFYTVYINYYNY